MAHMAHAFAESWTGTPSSPGDGLKIEVLTSDWSGALCVMLSLQSALQREQALVRYTKTVAGGLLSCPLCWCLRWRLPQLFNLDSHSHFQVKCSWSVTKRTKNYRLKSNPVPSFSVSLYSLYLSILPHPFHSLCADSCVKSDSFKAGTFQDLLMRTW